MTDADTPESLHRVQSVQGLPRPVVAVPSNYPDGYATPLHRHERAQLAYAATGVLQVETADGAWIVPPQRALWLPAETRHRVLMQGDVAMRSLYFRPEAVPFLPPRVAVVPVSALLRELILRAVTLPALYDEEGAAGLMMRLIPFELRALEALPLHLPMPADRRLRRICQGLAARPEDGRTLQAWAEAAGASARTLARLFRRETGMGFAEWRQQARLLAALKRLGAGEPVTSVALGLGYDSPSAFAAMFRKALGVPPSRYFA